MINKPSSILPGNTPGELSPVIPVEYTNTAPVSVVRVDTAPYRFEQQQPSSEPTRAEDKKETDASKFPILRGFA